MDNQCDVCDNECSSEELRHNSFLMDIGRGSYRVQFACNVCRAQLNQVSTDWSHVFVAGELLQAVRP